MSDQTNPGIWSTRRQSFIHNVAPVPVHSHNDYSRSLPLFEALGSGCISVEADVHLDNFDLLVGHTAEGLHPGSSLRSMYLEPLQRMLEAQNVNISEGMWRGIFNKAPQQTVVLLVDHKSAGTETFAELYTQLQPLRDLGYLTYWNGTERVMGPLTVVATGNAPFTSVTALNTTHRDIFWDAPLHILSRSEDHCNDEISDYKYNPSNSYFASARYIDARFTAYAVNAGARWPCDMARPQIEQARNRGLISRYWDTPSTPPNLRDIVWRLLVASQVGILNMDDLGIVRSRALGWGQLPNKISNQPTG